MLSMMSITKNYKIVKLYTINYQKATEHKSPRAHFMHSYITFRIDVISTRYAKPVSFNEVPWTGTAQLLGTGI